MTPDVTFPLPWEQVLWSSTPAFPLSVSRRGTNYAFTDFRLVVSRRNRTIDELALHDIESVRLTQSRWQRLAGTSTVRVSSRRSRAPLELANIRHGPQLALILQLRATDVFGDGVEGDRPGIFPKRSRDLVLRRSCALTRGSCSPQSASSRSCSRLSALRGCRHCHRCTTKRTIRLRRTAAAARAARSAAFMERDVMPFARTALGPLVGGQDNVTCATCHGNDAEQRRWQMPGVRALPGARAEARRPRARAVVARIRKCETRCTDISPKKTSNRSPRICARSSCPVWPG